MKDFPFDRQLISLDVFEFVWQEDKDSLDYDFSMQIVSFRIECVSMLPEWKSATAIIEVDEHNVRKQVCRKEQKDEPPNYANRFKVRLRLERKNWYYLVQIFSLTIIITIASTLPLLMPAAKDHIGDRLGLYSGGILTLTSFKYSIGDNLPSVPYSTKFDRIMLTEVVSVIGLAMWSLIAYRYVEQSDDPGFDEPPDGQQGSLFNFVTVDVFEIYLFIF